MKLLSELIDDALETAQTCIILAIEAKDERRSLADILHGISVDELRHARELHCELIRLRAEHGEPSADMQTIYDYILRRRNEKAEEIERLQANFANQNVNLNAERLGK